MALNQANRAVIFQVITFELPAVTAIPTSVRPSRGWKRPENAAKMALAPFIQVIAGVECRYQIIQSQADVVVEKAMLNIWQLPRPACEATREHTCPA